MVCRRSAGVSLTNHIYEFVPLLEIPQVDLSVSLESRLHNSHLQRLTRRVTRSPLTFLGFLVYLGCSIFVLVIPASLGRGLAVLGCVAGLSSAVSLIATLRYEMVVVLLHTYDVWFFVVTSIIGASMLALILNDLRGLIILVSWPAYLVNVFVDANRFGTRNIWIGNFFAVIASLAVSVCISTDITPEIHAFNVLRVNTHSLPSVALLRDCQLTMVVGILRNLARRAHRVVRRDRTTAARTNSTHYSITCVSFRCRLQLQPMDNHSPTSPRSRLLSGSTIQPVERREGVRETAPASAAKTQLEYMAFGVPIDVRNTVLRLSHHGPAWTYDPRSQVPRRIVRTRWVFKAVAMLGFVIANLSNVTISLAPLLANHSILLHSYSVFMLAAIGFASSLVFSIVCLAACQRQFLYALATSFDFVFTAGQATLLHLTLMEMTRWIPATTLSLASSLLWSMWLLYWDALTPVVRKRLGLSSRLAAWVALVLMLTLLANGVLIFVVLQPTALRDRAIAAIHVVGKVVEFRTVSWFFSSSVTMATWATRLIWRLWHATDHERVVLDGPVVYERLIRIRGRSVAPSPSRPT